MIDHFKKIFEYENWANNEIVQCLTGVEDVPHKAVSLMSHIINAQIVWVSRINNEITDVKVWQEYDKNELSHKLKVSSEMLTKLTNTLTQKDLKREISYKNTKGEKFDTALSDILNQLSHHSAYHRGQIVSLIKPIVSDLPMTDYIVFIRTVKN